MNADEVLKATARESVKQGENLRSAVRELTLNALRSRELTLSEIKRVVRSVTEGVNLGAATSKIDAAMEEFGNRMHEAVKQQRRTALKAAEIMAGNFTALASGILIGMTEGLEQGRRPGGSKGKR